MLLYGNCHNIPNDCKVINFSSLITGYPDAKLLPPNNLGAINEYDFDIKYMHYILDIDTNFINFMNLVMEIYYGNDIYLIISEDAWSNTLIESLLKLMQQRYGLNAIFINSEEDYIYEKLNGNCTEFNSSYGIANFMIDKDRYVYLYAYEKAKKGDVPNGV